MNPMYDVVILGCGEAGIFAAYELARLHPDLKITALDKNRREGDNSGTGGPPPVGRTGR